MKTVHFKAFLRAASVIPLACAVPGLAQAETTSIPAGTRFLAECEVISPAVFYSRLLRVGHCEVKEVLNAQIETSDIVLPESFSVGGARAEEGYYLQAGSLIRLKLESYLTEVYIDSYNTETRLAFRLVPPPFSFGGAPGSN